MCRISPITNQFKSAIIELTALIRPDEQTQRVKTAVQARQFVGKASPIISVFMKNEPDRALCKKELFLAGKQV